MAVYEKYTAFILSENFAMSRAEDIFQRLVYFGEDAIDEFIVNGQTEELFLDFKQAVSTGKNFNTLHRDDRKNLAKAISGFGNSEGGVVVWGVECARDAEVGDVAQAKVKVKNVHRFLSWLEGAISGCTIPSHNGVRNHIISCDENGDGFIATYIPKSEGVRIVWSVSNLVPDALKDITFYCMAVPISLLPLLTLPSIDSTSLSFVFV